LSHGRWHPVLSRYRRTSRVASHPSFRRARRFGTRSGVRCHHRALGGATLDDARPSRGVVRRQCEARSPVTFAAALTLPAAGLDALRARALAAVGPHTSRLLRDRELRVLVYGLGSVAMALACTFLAPMMLLAVGPVVLGVPHLAADL